jgi:hypothetical protein
MVALLLAAALVGLTILALMLVGVIAAIVTGIALVNSLALLIGLRTGRTRSAPASSERWRPRAFSRPPRPPPLDPEAEEQLKSFTPTVHRR